MDKITKDFYSRVERSKSPEETAHAISKFIRETAQRISYQNPLTDITAVFYAAAYYELYRSVYSILGDSDKKLCDKIIESTEVSTVCIRFDKPFDNMEDTSHAEK